MTTPQTRARNATGTRSKIAVSMIGFNAPANSPLTTVTATSAATGAPSANAKNRGGPQRRNATKNVARLGSRCPNAENSSAPASAAPPMTPTSSPSTRRSFSTVSAYTGSIRPPNPASSMFVTRHMSTIERTVASRFMYARPSRRSAR